MVTSSERLSLVFAALADPIRREILGQLSLRGATVGELARPFRVSRPAISKHLRVLERAKLVRRERDGRVNRCQLDAVAMREAAEWFEHYEKFWTNRLAALKRYAEKPPTPRSAERKS